MATAPLNFESFDYLKERCLSVSDQAPLIFLVGSGVSMDFPSVLPGVWRMIEDTFNEVLPGNPFDIQSKDDLEKLLASRWASQLLVEKEQLHSRILPEIYYETLVEILGPDPLRVWEALRFWESDPELRTFGLGPNRGHLLIVYLAWLGKAPVITTNFDTLLEEAARDLGLDPQVCYPGETFTEASTTNAIAIWKIHGSADTTHFHTIRSTLRTLTMTDPLVVEAVTRQFKRPNAVGCLIGYSGRDLDLFPYVVQSTPVEPIRWIDPRFNDWHMIHHFTGLQSPCFIPIKGTSSELADIVIPSLLPDGSRTFVLQTSLKVSATQKQQALDTYHDRLQQHVRNVLNPLLSKNDPRRILIHALALFRIGELARSSEYLNSFLDLIRSKAHEIEPRLVVRTFLTKAAITHDIARFEDSFQYAESARRIAQQNRLRLLEMQAIMEADEALRVQYIPRLRFHDSALLLRMNAWYAAVRMIIHTMSLARSCWPTNSFPTNVDSNEFARTSSLYLEHCLRLGTLIQGVVSNLPLIRTIIHPLLTKFWVHLLKISIAFGFAKNVGSISRYMERLGIPPVISPMIVSKHVFDLTSDIEGKAMVDREEGERLYGKAKTIKDVNEKNILLKEASAAYERAYNEAKKHGDNSLVLKALIERRRLEPDFRISTVEFETIMSEIQGDGYRRMASRLWKWLCKP